MTRRKWITLGATIVVMTIGAELLVRPWNSSKGRLKVDNQGDAPMNDLVVSYGETTVKLGTLKAGASTTVWFTAAGKGTLSLEFNQKGNPMKGFQVQDFDPAENLKDGLKMVLIVKDNRIERFMDDDDSTTSFQALKDGFSNWLEPITPP